MRAFLLATLAIFFFSSAKGEQLRLDGDQFWVGLASAPSADEAIGLAKAFLITPLLVVSSANGFYAAVSGPYHVPPGGAHDFLDKLRKDKGAPADAYLTRGAHYGGVVWRPPADHVEATLEYDGEHEASLDRGDLSLTMSRQRDGKDFVPVLTARYKSGKPLRLVLGNESSNEKPASTARLVRLDPTSPQPTIVFTYYWQGAHCCTVTKFATLQRDGSWATVGVGPLDSEGYQFEDLDGSGRSYLVGIDQNFLYAFASYAGSFAPIKIEKLDGAQITDVTHDAAMRRFVTQDMYRQRALQKEQGSDSEANGYLASFVAEEMLLGEGPAAWQKMLTAYDRSETMFGVDKCLTDLPLDKCPDSKKGKLPYPAGLRQFLVEHGYMTDPDNYPVPSETALPIEPEPAPATVPAEPQAAATPPQLQRCVDVADTVRKLIYQRFAGRNVTPGETYDDVTLDNDETLEGYDAGIAKVTCAVGYTFVPRALIGRLAEDGNIGRAAMLGRLSRMRGGSLAGRLRYTVKPTATAGTSYIELMP